MKDKVKIVTSMLIFGSIGVFIRHIYLSSLEIAFLRATIGSLFMLGVVCFLYKKISYDLLRRNILILALSGATLGFNWICLFQAYKFTTVSIATFSYYFAPIFVIILSPIVLKEKLTLTKMMTIALAMLGLFLILNTGQNQLSSSYNHLLGIFYGLLGAIFYAGVILMNKFIKDLSGFETTLVQLIASAVVLLPAILFQDTLNINAISFKSWMLIFVVGVIHTGLAYLLYFTAIKGLKGHSIAILSYIDPVFAIVCSYFFLNEVLTLAQIIGGALILIAAFISER